MVYLIEHKKMCFIEPQITQQKIHKTKTLFGSQKLITFDDKILLKKRSRLRINYLMMFLRNENTKHDFGHSTK